MLLAEVLWDTFYPNGPKIDDKTKAFMVSAHPPLFLEVYQTCSHSGCMLLLNDSNRHRCLFRWKTSCLRPIEMATYR